MRSFEAVAPLLDLSPAHWTHAEFRRLVTLREWPNANGKLTPLSLGSAAGEVRARGEDARQQPSDDYVRRYWHVIPGDLVVNPMWLIGGSIGVSKVEGAVSPDYRVYASGPLLHPQYLHHLLRSKPYFDQYNLLVRAQTTFDRRITKQDFHELPVPVPPLPEQRAIADYLDTETARIDALITKKRRMIELLKERRQAFVSRAVTEGLDSELLRPSGNEFALEVPESWRLLRLRHALVGIIDTPHKTAPVVEEPRYLVVRTANVKNGRLVFNDARYTDRKSWLDWNRRGQPRPGDVMFTREAPAGEACMVPNDQDLCIGQRMVLLQVDNALLSGEWLVHSIYSGSAQRFIEVLSNSTTVAHLNMSDIPDIPIAVPPIAEQRRILDAVTHEVDRQENASHALEQQIDLLAEHREALITAAVIGELEIPVAA